jgi:phosphoglycolate phosphatase-like HAD superfamily hydrolase
MQKLVLFDIDGTIMHNGGAGRDAMEHALQTVFGTKGSTAYRYDGKTDKQIVRELMQLEGHDDTWIDVRMEQVTQLYVETLQKTLAEDDRDIGMYEGVAALIDAVDARDDAVLGLLTGNIETGARLKLQAVGLDTNRFVINAFGSDHETRGELPAIACRRLRESLGIDIPGHDVIVIGDTPADIHCGRDIGARAIGVATGRYSVRELQEHDPFAVFETLRDTDAVMQVIYA